MRLEDLTRPELVFPAVHAADADGVSGYWWSFGDLSGSPGATHHHTYRAPGTYRAAVWAADGLGRTSVRELPVVVP